MHKKVKDASGRDNTQTGLWPFISFFDHYICILSPWHFHTYGLKISINAIIKSIRVHLFRTLHNKIVFFLQSELEFVHTIVMANISSDKNWYCRKKFPNRCQIWNHRKQFGHWNLSTYQLDNSNACSNDNKYNSQSYRYCGRIAQWICKKKKNT